MCFSGAQGEGQVLDRCWFGLRTLKKDEGALGSAHGESKEAALGCLGGKLLTFLSGSMFLGVKDPVTEKLPACLFVCL